MAPKKKGAKGKKGGDFGFDSDNEPELDLQLKQPSAGGGDSDADEPAAAPAAAAKKPAGGGKKKAGGKKGSAAAKFAFASDDDEDVDLAPAASGSGEEDDEEDEDEAFVARAKPKAGKAKAKAKPAVASAFDLLGGDEDGGEEEEQEDEQEEEEEEAGGGAPKASGFAALMGDDDEEAPEEDEQPAVEDDGEPKPKKEKKKKKDKGKDMSSLFAALEEDAGAAPAAEAGEEGGEASAAAADKKKKKKKKEMNLDGLLAEMGEDAGGATAEDGDKAEKKKEKKKSKKDKKDVDSLMAALQLDGAEAPAAPAAGPKEDAGGSSGGGGKAAAKKKGKGGKAAAEEDDEELAAILAELEAPKPAAAPAAAEGGAGGGKKKKKKGGGGAAAAADDDDIDALLAELDGPKAAAAPASAAAAEPAPAPAPAAAAEAAAGGGDDDDDDDEAGGEGKELTAAQKKKLKKKQKEKEKKAAAAAGGEAEAAEAEGGGEGVAAGKKGKGGPVKESAAVRRMREQLEARQRAEEEARAAEEARRAAEEAEIARLEEEERLRAEEKERKRAAAKAKKEELKRQGKLLTGKAKAEAERLAAIRAQLLAQAAEKGLQLEGEAEEEAEKKPKKVVYTSKKKLQRKKSEGVEGDAADEAAAAAAEQQEQQPGAEQAAAPQEQQQQQPEPAGAEAAAEKQESEGLDDWEQAADSWEELDKEEEEEGEQQPAAAAAAANGKGKEEEGSSEEEEDEDESSGSGSDDDDEDGSSSSGSGSDDESSSYTSSDSEEDSEEERERRIEEARDKRLARLAAARANADRSVLRSPICCILGHVDVGKTKILDNIRRTNVQDGEAGGITQQIGATFVPADAIDKRTQSLRGGRPFDMRLPGLLVIDTPGHESFTNLRARGSGLCDVAVLIVDLMHGLEQQTIESINMLKMRKTPFIIALNKVDRLYGWKSAPDSPVREAFKRQKDHVMKEFEDRSSQVFLQLNEQGLNVSLYWKNPDPRKYVNVVPTSAITGEGIPDLLQLMVKLTQTMMQDRLTLLSETQCTVLEVKTMEGLGTTVDVVLVNGTLREGDRVVVCGLGGPIVTRIKSLKTPQVMKEMRVKGALVEHKEVRAAMGVKIVAPGLESAVAGTSLYVVGPEDDEEELKEAVMEDMADIFSKVDKSGEGVCVQASTLGSLEALLAFLDSDDVQIPVSGINIGPVHKRDVLRANVMNEKGSKKFAVILAFDVPVSREAREMAAEYNVKIFTADIIYHLFDQFTAYMKQIRAQEQEAARLDAVFPCVLQILPTCVFNKKDPIVVGVEVAEGIARVGTPLAVPTQDGIELGRISSLELNHKAVESARAGQSVAMKIEPGNAIEQSRMYGRHFDHNDQLVSKITRESINALKAHFADEMTKDDWRLVVKLKKVFGVQ